MKPSVVDACFQTAAVARSDAAHAGQPVTVGVRIGFGRAQVGMHRAGNGIVDGEHEHAFVEAAAQPHRGVGTAAGALAGIVEGVAQEGAEVGVGHRERCWQHSLEITGDACSLDGVGFGGEDHVGGVVVAEAARTAQRLAVAEGIEVGAALSSLPSSSRPLAAVMWLRRSCRSWRSCWSCWRSPS